MVQTRRQSAARAEAPPAVPATKEWRRQPVKDGEHPPFTVATLRKAIPAHCFKRSLLRSSAYVAGDLLMLAALVWASGRIDAAPVPPAVRWLVLWPLYWFFAGAVATGLWVSAGVQEADGGRCGGRCRAGKWARTAAGGCARRGGGWRRQLVPAVGLPRRHHAPLHPLSVATPSPPRSTACCFPSLRQQNDDR